MKRATRMLQLYCLFGEVFLLQSSRVFERVVNVVNETLCTGDHRINVLKQDCSLTAEKTVKQC